MFATVLTRTNSHAAAADGFQNILFKLGGADPMQATGGYAQNQITRNRQSLEAAYRTNWVAGKIVDCVADDMTRAGIEIQSTDKPDDIKKIQNEFLRLGVHTKVNENIKWGRLYGGSIAVMMIEGQKFEDELYPARVAKDGFLGLKVFDRWLLQPSLNDLVATGPDAGLPKFYTITYSPDQFGVIPGQVSGLDTGKLIMAGQKIHHSRVLRYVGINLAFYQSLSEWLWGESVLERAWDRVLAFDSATASANALLKVSYLRTVGVEGMREILAAGGDIETNFVKYWQYVSLLQSISGITLLDKADEFKTQSYTFAGIVDVIVQLGQQISGATGIPLTRLFGQAPAGMNSTGESDMRNYYDMVNAEQESRLRPHYYRLLQVIYPSLFGRPMPDDMTLIFNPLWQMTTKEKAEIAERIGNVICNLLNAHGITVDIALKELKQCGHATGFFTNITDDDIREAEQEPPEAEEVEPAITVKGDPGEAAKKIAWQPGDIDKKAA